MWDRWQKGVSLQQIVQLFERTIDSASWRKQGGIRPAVRNMFRLALTLPYRKEISRAVVAGNTICSIAALLGLAPSA